MTSVSFGAAQTVFPPKYSVVVVCLMNDLVLCAKYITRELYRYNVCFHVAGCPTMTNTVI